MGHDRPAVRASLTPEIWRVGRMRSVTAGQRVATQASLADPDDNKLHLEGVFLDLIDARIAVQSSERFGLVQTNRPLVS